MCRNQSQLKYNVKYLEFCPCLAPRIMEIPELTPAVITAVSADEEGNPIIEVFVMNKIIPGWYDTSFEEWWDAHEEQRS